MRDEYIYHVISSMFSNRFIKYDENLQYHSKYDM